MIRVIGKGKSCRRDGHEPGYLRVIQELQRVGYSLATHEQGAVVGVAALAKAVAAWAGCDVSAACVGLSIGDVLRVRFFRLYQCA